MASGKRRNDELLPLDKGELRVASAYAKQSEEKLKELADEFDSKGNLGLFWDSKVPDKDKGLFYFFSLGFSDPEEVKAEIKKYLQFYREMNEIAGKISTDDSDEDDDEFASQKNKDALKLINELQEHLTKLSGAAEAGEKTTGSRALGDLHREFVDKHEKLESLIKRVKTVAVTKDHNQSLKKISQMEDRHKNVCDMFEQLFTKHNIVKGEKTELERANDSLQEHHQQLLERRNNLQREHQQLLERSNDREEQMAVLMEKHQQLLERSNNREQQLETLEQRNKRLEQERREQQERSERLDQERREQELKNERLERTIKELREQQQELFDRNTTILNLLKTMAEEKSGSNNSDLALNSDLA